MWHICALGALFFFFFFLLYLRKDVTGYLGISARGNLFLYPSLWGKHPTLGASSSRGPKSYQRGFCSKIAGAFCSVIRSHYCYSFPKSIRKVRSDAITMPLPQLLVGKVAAITGGLTGIGRVITSFPATPVWNASINIHWLILYRQLP
jgi:hypothetical protein